MNYEKEANVRLAGARIQASTQLGLGTIAKDSMPTPVLNHIMERLAKCNHDFQNTLERTNNLGDRFFGATPSTASKDEGQPNGGQISILEWLVMDYERKVSWLSSALSRLEML